MAPASDLFSKLTDDLLCFILSYLPIKEAVRSSVLSTRWRYLYNQLPKLTLSPDLIRLANPNRLAIAQVENIISNILLLHSSHLETFDLYTRNDWQFTPQNLCKWVHCVALKNVEGLSLCYFPHPSISNPMEIPPSLFLCTKLRSLTLFHYIVSRIPTGFGGFKHLTHCFFRKVQFRDDSLALFLFYCPLLEALNLEDCFLPQNITISAPHIEHLSIQRLLADNILTVNCPKLRHLELSGNTLKDFRVNGLSFQALSSAVTPNLLQGLPHLETLSIGAISLSLTKDPIPTSLESPLVNLRMVDACLTRNYGEKEIHVLVWLLGNSPALETMNVTVPPPQQAGKNAKYIQLLQRLMDSNSKRPSAPARLRVKEG